MLLLLDTHVLLWSVFEYHRLSAAARQALANTENILYFSAVSAWEVATKVQTGKLVLFGSVHEFIEAQCLHLGLTKLPLTVDHATTVSVLPPIHRDPADRLLIAQAMVEGLTLVTADAFIRQSDVPTLW